MGKTRGPFNDALPMQLFYFGNLQGRYPMSHSLEDDKFLCSIQRDSLDVILRWRIDKVENILMLLKNMHMVGD